MPFYNPLTAMGVASPGLAVLGLVVIFLALFSLVRGAFSALFERGAPLLARVWRNTTFRIGLTMLGGFPGAALVFAADAALKLAH